MLRDDLDDGNGYDVEHLGPYKPNGKAHVRPAPAIRTAAELQRKVFPPIKWIVPGYLAEGCTLLAGRPKLGKSWLALDIGLAVAAGRYVLGEILCEAGDVLCLALEDNERRLNAASPSCLAPSGPSGRRGSSTRRSGLAPTRAGSRRSGTGSRRPKARAW
jgi:AAA domain-containing protein